MVKQNHLEFQALDWHSGDTNDFDAEYDDGSDYSTRYLTSGAAQLHIDICD